MALDLNLEQVTGFTAGCIQEEPAPCIRACPFSVNIRNFLKRAAKGRMPAAYRDLRSATLFPTVARAFCSAPCMGGCQRLLNGDEAVDLPRIEEAVLRLAGHQPPDVFQIPRKEEYPIAVVGAGPAGLALALVMAQKKYPVTVFDEREGWGGSLREDPRFPAFDEDFQTQFSMEQVEFRFGTRAASLEELSGFSAVYVATGENGTDFGLKDAWDPATGYARDSRCFLGGGVVGQSVVDSLARAGEISRLMEGLVQTGRPEGASPAHTACDYRLIEEDEPHAPHVEPVDPDGGYTKDEVKAEAGRCVQCSCDKCIKRCDLLGQYKKPPKQCAMEVLADSGPHFLASRTMTRETYSCNLCGYCGSICPGAVDMGELFAFSRQARAQDHIQPEAFHDFWLRELELAMGEGFYAAPPKGAESCKLALFPGCRLSDALPEQTLKAWELLNAIEPTGIVLGCCGAPAWWAGEEERLDKVREQLLAAWERLGRPTFAAACCSCVKVLNRFVPEIPVMSLYEHSALKEVSAQALFDTAAVFDPCSARETPQVRAAVRRLAAAAGTKLEERKEPGQCCGYGGHMKVANPKLYHRIAQERAEETPLPYLVYCANCREVFLSQGKPCRHILEQLFGAEERTFTISEKHRNLLRLKGELMQRMEGTTFTPQTHPWDELKLDIPEEVRGDMEENFISEENVRECIFRAEESGQCFTDGSGVYLACLGCRVITFWVEYQKTQDGYAVLSAYSHRMKFDKGEGK